MGRVFSPSLLSFVNNVEEALVIGCTAPIPDVKAETVEGIAVIPGNKIPALLAVGKITIPLHTGPDHNIIHIPIPLGNSALDPHGNKTKENTISKPIMTVFLAAILGTHDVTVSNVEESSEVSVKGNEVLILGECPCTPSYDGTHDPGESRSIDAKLNTLSTGESTENITTANKVLAEGTLALVISCFIGENTHT